MNYGEYTTIANFRGTWQGSEDPGQDPLILRLIRSVSENMNPGGRRFSPIVETRYYDVVGSRQLTIDDTDWLEITTITNGDGSVIASTNYDLLPYAGPPYYAVRLKLTAGLIWNFDTSGSPERAIRVAGVTGYVHDYGNAWIDSGSTIGNNPLTAGGTSITGITTDTVFAGQLIRLGTTNDFAYVRAMNAGGTVATVARSVNGSTGIQHAQGTAIYTWNPGYDIESLCCAGVQALIRLKDNPTGDTIRIGDDTFSTPKDVNAWLGKQIDQMGYSRPY